MIIRHIMCSVPHSRYIKTIFVYHFVNSRNNGARERRRGEDKSMLQTGASNMDHEQSHYSRGSGLPSGTGFRILESGINMEFYVPFRRRLTFLIRSVATWAAIIATLVVLLAPAACSAQWWCGTRDADCSEQCTECESESGPAHQSGEDACGDECVCLSICNTPILLTARPRLQMRWFCCHWCGLPISSKLPAGFIFESIEPPQGLC